MRNEQHYRRMLEQNPNASVNLTLAAAMVYAARYGLCEAEQHGTDEFREIARRLKHSYGETLDPDQVLTEMNAANRSAAAAMLRAIPSEIRSQRSRENGKRGGRPRKQTN